MTNGRVKYTFAEASKPPVILALCDDAAAELTAGWPRGRSHCAGIWVFSPGVSPRSVSPRLMMAGRFSMITMPGLQSVRFSLQELVHVALSILAVCSGVIAVAAPPGENSYAVSLR